MCLRYPLHRYSRSTPVAGERYPLSSGEVWAPVTNSDPVELVLALLLCGETLVHVRGKPDIGTSPSGAVYRVGMMLPTTALVPTLYSGLPADHPAHQGRAAERWLCYQALYRRFLVTSNHAVQVFLYCFVHYYISIVNTNFLCMLCLPWLSMPQHQLLPMLM